MPYIPPDQYASTSAYVLLEAASQGFIGFDQRLIHALVDPPDRLPDILRFIQDKDFPKGIRADLILLLRHFNPPEAVPYYIRAIEEDLEDVPDYLTDAVVAAGARMLEPLLELYNEVGEEDGQEIAFLLAGLGIRDDRVLNILLEQLEYDADAGSIPLGLYGDRAAIPHLQRILGEVAPDDTDLRRQIETAIKDIEDYVPPSGLEPFNIFEYYPEEAGPEFELLSEQERLTLLDNAPVEVRREAASSFSNTELTTPVRDRLLEAAQHDSDPEVRGNAWQSLRDFEDDPKIRSAMLKVAREGEPAERAGAVVALASGREPSEEVFELIEALYEVPEQREKALEAMWKSLDRRFQPYVLRNLEPPNISPNAVLGIGYLGLSSETNRLIPWFKLEEVREEALIAYAFAAPIELSRASMKPFLRRIGQLADGLTAEEEIIVKEAIDQRLEANGLKRVFNIEEDEPEPKPPVAQLKSNKVGRNDPCPCGSGKKYKKCHGA